LIEGAMGKRPSYREIEHTADLGVELNAPDLRSAFEGAAAAMFDVVSDLDRVGETWHGRVRVEGLDLGNLMVRWLSELLFVSESEGVLLSHFTVERLDGLVLEAAVAGEKLDRARHAVRVEIKAPTYHGLRIEESDNGWFVRVIFDT
jgi:SHS2 domain-containing protein